MFTAEQEAALRAKAARMCEEAIGKTMTVSFDSNKKVTGEIVTCEFGHFNWRARSVQVIFKVGLRSASGKVFSFNLQRV